MLATAAFHHQPDNPMLAGAIYLWRIGIRGVAICLKAIIDSLFTLVPVKFYVMRAYRLLSA